MSRLLWGISSGNLHCVWLSRGQHPAQLRPSLPRLVWGIHIGPLLWVEEHLFISGLKGFSYSRRRSVIFNNLSRSCLRIKLAVTFKLRLIWFFNYLFVSFWLGFVARDNLLDGLFHQFEIFDLVDIFKVLS
jgi:hypothetical protein